MRTAKAALAYFALVFATGFVLGLVRVPFLVPRFGERTAELLEMPFMLVAIVLAARWVVRHFGLAMSARTCLGAGALALALLLAVEFGVVLSLRGLTLEQYFASRDPVAGAVYLAMLLLFALMPALLVRWKAN